MIPIVIPAKGGSTRLPNKNMVMLNGRHMIDYSIDQALESKKADAIYVSTDSEAIAEHARSRDINVIMRPESLGGEVGLLDVYRHALENINDDSVKIFVGLQPDHPDRKVSVDEAIEMFQAEDGLEMLASQESDGTKNGSHCIVTAEYLVSGKSPADDPINKLMIVDDCTNVHFLEDLKKAEEVISMA
jgi:CMP-N-acetylneuraminic acid synthetase